MQNAGERTRADFSGAVEAISTARTKTSNILAVAHDTFPDVDDRNSPLAERRNARAWYMRATLLVDGTRSDDLQSLGPSETARVLAPLIHVHAVRRSICARTHRDTSIGRPRSARYKLHGMILGIAEV